MEVANAVRFVRWSKGGQPWMLLHELAQRQICDSVLCPTRQLARTGREASRAQAGRVYLVGAGPGDPGLLTVRGAEVLRSVFGIAEGFPQLTVLDTTDELTLVNARARLNPTKTLFIVASKSGSTAEPHAFCDYFYEKLKTLKGSYAGGNFIAITDPGSELVRDATERRFRRTFLNFPDIGGRYSAVS